MVKTNVGEILNNLDEIGFGLDRKLLKNLSSNF